MLNYIWIALVAIGILVAVGNDLNDEWKNTYRNGVPFAATLEIRKYPTELRTTWEGELVIPSEVFHHFYGTQGAAGEIRQTVSLTTAENGASALVMSMSESSPARWKEMARFAATKDKLTGRVQSIRFSEDRKTAQLQIVFEPIRFVKLKAVTQAALDYAKTAVEIALGLIGIMALWLGVMKVAEEAGLVKTLTKLLTPLARRLFPDVPSDHPAIGAMIMNIAANMLGLSNAATPFGLKAMEELNKLNPKLGTATNAMCTFLAINTSGLVLLPATALAVRAAVGSSNPGMIIGTSIVGAGCATIAGLIAVKLLEKLPRFTNDLLPDSSDPGKEVNHG
jgi:spore maturation protein A